MDARQKVNFHKYSSGCVGPLKPEVVESTSYDCRFLASSVLILAEEDKYKGLPTGVSNYWLAQDKRRTGQGFTIKLDDCARAIAGCQIKNKGKGSDPHRATKKFSVSGKIPYFITQLCFYSFWCEISLFG